jgi:hypothetical protein
MDGKSQLRTPSEPGVSTDYSERQAAFWSEAEDGEMAVERGSALEAEMAEAPIY